VRDETALGRKPVSVSHAAVAQAKDLLGNLRGREVLLVGAGEMTEVALRLLHKQGIGRCYLGSRTIERAARVAGHLGAEAIDLGKIDQVIDGVDLILCSSSAPHYVLDADEVRRIQVRWRERPLVIVDMAVPRDVDPPAGEVPGVHLLNLDDLQSIGRENIEGRRAFVPAAEKIVDEERDRLTAALDARASAPLITDLVDRVELEPIDTRGDRASAMPLTEASQEGIFVKELEQALLDGRAEIAVHSAKDLPTDATAGLVLSAFLPRADARDVLIARETATLSGLPAGARIGTGSPRRSAQLAARRTDLRFAPIRGNVDTRLG